MRFVDRVRIFVKAGDGGDGVVAWRREAHIAMGGPAGGDGGHGGDVVLVADESLSTLLDLKFRSRHLAQDGRPGQSKEMNGRGGDPRVIRVPVGTVAYFEGVPDEDGRAPWLAPLEDLSDEDGGEGAASSHWWNEGDLEGNREGDDGADEEDADDTSHDAEDGTAAGDAGTSSNSGSERTRSSSEFEDADQDASAAGEAAPSERARGGKQARRRRGARKRRSRDDMQDDMPREIGDLLGDLSEPGQTLVIARGGRGGRGNIHFKTSTNRAPDRSEPGTAGQELFVRLELKLLADVGIVGFPNVGKSTLIRAISRARPKVGAYPFTTLVPQLGLVSLGEERSFVIADVPGLVRGASQGRGLGLQFLRHLERTRVLLHLLAPDPTEGREPLADLQALEEELEAYGDMFRGRPRVVALNKLDDPDTQALVAPLRRALRARNIPLFTISAATGEGVPALLEAIWRRLEMVRGAPSSRSSGSVPGDPAR